MKRASNLKDSIMMPPPKARPKSRSDTSEELRRNLLETVTNSSENYALHEKFHKFFKEMEELDKKNDDDLSVTKSINSLNYQLHSSLQNQTNSIQSPSSQKEKPNNASFNFNLVNYNYNYTCSEEDENTESITSLEKLKKNLTGINSNTGKNANASVSTIHQLFKVFKKLPIPKDNKEIKYFVNNIFTYINDHEYDSNMQLLKIKLQTRFNDFKNKGLKVDYFKECLEKMQKELISRICMLTEEDKKIENGLINF